MIVKRWFGGQAEKRMERGAAAGLRAAADHLLEVASDRVPLESGRLQQSGTASVDEAGLVAAVAYDTEYAVRQHEDLTYFQHDAGRGGKYLEKPFHSEQAKLKEIVGDEVRRAL